MQAIGSWAVGQLLRLALPALPLLLILAFVEAHPALILLACSSLAGWRLAAAAGQAMPLSQAFFAGEAAAGEQDEGGVRFHARPESAA